MFTHTTSPLRLRCLLALLAARPIILWRSVCDFSHWQRVWAMAPWINTPGYHITFLYREIDPMFSVSQGWILRRLPRGVTDGSLLFTRVGSSRIVEREVMATYETIRGLQGLFSNLIISLSVRYLFSSLLDRLPATHFIITIFIMVLFLLFILATSGSRF